jgi:hypothetical protein
MPFVWLVDCKTCTQRFAILPREVAPKDRAAEASESSGVARTSGGTRIKSTSTLPPGEVVGTFECPHCHETDSYLSEDLIPGEGRIIHK